MKIKAIVNGKTYTRTIQWRHVSYDGEEYPEKVPFITINNRLYVVLIQNGQPKSFCDWERYQEQFQQHAPHNQDGCVTQN